METNGAWDRKREEIWRSRIPACHWHQLSSRRFIQTHTHTTFMHCNQFQMCHFIGVDALTLLSGESTDHYLHKRDAPFHCHFLRLDSSTLHERKETAWACGGQPGEWAHEASIFGLKDPNVSHVFLLTPQAGSFASCSLLAVMVSWYGFRIWPHICAQVFEISEFGLTLGWHDLPFKDTAQAEAKQNGDGAWIKSIRCAPPFAWTLPAVHK